MTTPLTYRDAGVDLDAADAVKSSIARRLSGTLFGGFVPVPQLTEYSKPVLVSSIDGVGTKVGLAAHLGQYGGLGQDIVHHCVNDIAVHGASPLFFLDYLAFHRLDVALVDELVTRIAEACDALGIPLAGGETAEMPLVYPEGHFDIAGAIVGVVEAQEIIDGAAINAGDVVLAMPSNGLHTNGYSLVQQIFSDGDYLGYRQDLGQTLGEALLEPHRAYPREIRRLVATSAVHGLVHVTGGGIGGNLARILPPDVDAVITLPPTPPLFNIIQERGISVSEMVRVFNMGIGLIAVCDPVPELYAGRGLEADGWQIVGTIQPGKRRVHIERS